MASFVGVSGIPLNAVPSVGQTVGAAIVTEIVSDYIYYFPCVDRTLYLALKVPVVALETVKVRHPKVLAFEGQSA